MDNGNVEVAIIGKLKNNQNLFNELSFREISEDDARNSIRKMDLFSSNTFPSHEVIILMAAVGAFGELVLHYDGVTEEKKLSLVLHTSSDELKVPAILESNTKQKAFEARIAGLTTVWFEKDGSLVSNKIRVYNPSGSSLRIMDYKPDADRVPSLIANAKDLESLLQIILALLPEERYSADTARTRIPEPSPGRMPGGTTGESIYDILRGLLRVPRGQIGPSPVPEGPPPPSSHYPEREPEHVEIDYNYLAGILDRWTTAFSARRLATENSLLNYSDYLLVSLKLVEFFVKSDKEENRMQFLMRLTNTIASLIDKYGFSRNEQKDLQLFIPVLLYLENETSATSRSERNFAIRNRIAREMKELENLVISSGNPLKGLEFRNQVLAKWSELKLTPSNVDTTVLNKLISSLVAATILNKDEKTRRDICKGMVESVSELHDDTDALFLSYILRFLMIYDDDDKDSLRLEINKKIRERSLRGFRRTIYGDILNPKTSNY
jgi:hypothetical protein